MKFYDAHIHFVFKQPPIDFRDIVIYLEGIGVSGFGALVITEYPSDIRTIKKMIPEGDHKGLSLETFANPRESFFLFRRETQLEVVPYLDARFIETDIEQKILMYRSIGFKGLKLLYIPEEDALLKINGMQEAFGRDREKSEKITSLLIENASIQGMSILLHADLRRYGDFISEMIKEHPTTNFNIPHFGFSRRLISSLLEKYDNCYTDLSSMAPFVREAQRSYLEFIRHHQDRILFGSDAFIDQPETVRSMMEFFSSLIDDQELLTKIFNKNYLKFHKQ